MIKDISSVTLAFVYVNVLGYVFHSVVSRSLGPAGYGEFMVLYSFMLTVGNITALLAAVGIKTLVENFSKRFEYLRSLRIFSLAIGAFMAIFTSIFAPYLKNFLQVTQHYYFFIIVTSWLGMFLIAIERSFLQATGRFPLFAISSALELTVRLIAALGAIYAGLKVGGVLFSSVIGAFFVLLILLPVNGELFGRRAKLNFKKILTVALYASPIGFFIYGDSIFIKRFFDEHTAGLFASVSVVGKVMIWFILTMLGVYFPKFVQTKESASFKKFVWQMFAIVVLSEAGAQLACFIIGKPLFLLLFGVKFESALKFLPFYLIALLPLLFSIVFISIATALERFVYIIYIHLICFYAGFFFFSFTEIFDYLMYIFCINGFFVLLYFWIFKKVKS